MTAFPSLDHHAPPRARVLLLVLGLAEIGTGALLVALPETLFRTLLGAGLGAAGILAARVAGLALAALGLTWWRARTRLDRERLRELTGGFLCYNLGVGALFALVALQATQRLPFAWLVAVVHLLAAGLFLVTAKGARAS